MNWDKELATASALAHEAGALLLRLRQNLEVKQKTGADDLLTQADVQASELIVSGLKKAFPADGILSEEAADDPARLSAERVWIVDPIDGTQEYAGLESPDFVVSIGLSVAGEPVVGVVYAPATDELFTSAVGQAVQKNGVPVQPFAGQPYAVTVSDSEYARELHAYALANMTPSGSIALKLARIAAGEYDATFSISPRSEWDICAGHALVRAAGGDLLKRDGRPIHYNQLLPQLEQGVVGGQRAALDWLMSQLLRLDIPVTHLNLSPQDPAWTRLSAADQEWLAGQSGLCVRYSASGIGALVMVENGRIQRLEGNAAALAHLCRDVVRAGLSKA